MANMKRFLLAAARNRRAFAPLALLLVLAAGCHPTDSSQPPAPAGREGEDKLQVAAVNYPLAWLANRIGGKHVDVIYRIPAGIDPAFWEPASEDIQAIQEAGVILLNGANYAKWLAQATLPESRLVNTSKAFAKSYLKVEEAVIHSHGPGGDHSHEGIAFTTWLDFHQAELQATAIHDALAARLPDARAELKSNLEQVVSDLRSLDSELQELFNKQAGTPFLASHPVYQYFARRYKIDLESVHWEPDSLPPPEEWDALKARLDKRPARWMIWEGEPGEESVRKLQELNVGSVVFSPCGNRAESGDFMEVMRSNLDHLRQAFGSEPPANSEAP